GNASVVIFRHVDRSTRQGVLEGYRLILQIMDAGARVEFSEQEYLNDRPERLGDFFDMAQRESEIKRDRKLQGNGVRSARGEVNGKAPWGYELGKVNGLQVLVATGLGRTWIPFIYHEAVKGKSLRWIRNELTRAGVKSPQQSGTWNESTIKRIIATPTYHGGRVGKGSMEYKALVPVELWQQANAAVAGRF